MARSGLSKPRMVDWSSAHFGISRFYEVDAFLLSLGLDRSLAKAFCGSPGGATRSAVCVWSSNTLAGLLRRRRTSSDTLPPPTTSRAGCLDGDGDVEDRAARHPHELALRRRRHLILQPADRPFQRISDVVVLHENGVDAGRGKNRARPHLGE